MEYRTRHGNRQNKVFPATLVVKAIGAEKQLQTFKEDLAKVYPRQNLAFSHLIRNRDSYGFHIFVNILLPSSDKREQ